MTTKADKSEFIIPKTKADKKRMLKEMYFNTTTRYTPKVAMLKRKYFTELINSL